MVTWTIDPKPNIKEHKEYKHALHEINRAKEDPRKICQGRKLSAGAGARGEQQVVARWRAMWNVVCCAASDCPLVYLYGPVAPRSSRSCSRPLWCRTSLPPLARFFAALGWDRFGMTAFAGGRNREWLWRRHEGDGEIERWPVREVRVGIIS